MMQIQPAPPQYTDTLIQSYRIRHYFLKLQYHQIIPCAKSSLSFIRLEFLFVRSSPKLLPQSKCLIWRNICHELPNLNYSNTSTSYSHRTNYPREKFPGVGMYHRPEPSNTSDFSSTVDFPTPEGPFKYTPFQSDLLYTKWNRNNNCMHQPGQKIRTSVGTDLTHRSLFRTSQCNSYSNL